MISLEASDSSRCCRREILIRDASPQKNKRTANLYQWIYNMKPESRVVSASDGGHFHLRGACSRAAAAP